MQQDESNQQFKQHMQEVLTTVSHDVQNPLMNIDVLAGLLQKALADGKYDDRTFLEEKLPQYVSMMMASVADMKHKFHGLKNLRDWMFIQPHPAPINMHGLVSDVASALQINASQITLSLDKNCEFWADQEAMKRVVYELLSNALHAIDEKQGVMVVSVEHNDGEDVLIVEDDGYGMGTHDLKRIYEPYFVALSKSEMQQDHALSSDSCGMGLTIVKALTQAHDGRVWCESELGEGARFSVAFPEKKR